jgi:hypothetical protein
MAKKLTLNFAVYFRTLTKQNSKQMSNESKY